MSALLQHAYTGLAGFKNINFCLSTHYAYCVKIGKKGNG